MFDRAGGGAGRVIVSAYMKILENASAFGQKRFAFFAEAKERKSTPWKFAAIYNRYSKEFGKQ